LINLRGLTIDGAGGATNGIIFNTGGALNVENCVIRRFSVDGILFSPNNTNNSSSVSITNTIVNNNGNRGISISPGGATYVKGLINKVIANNNGAGVWVFGGNTTATSLAVTILDSVAFNNSGVGIAASSSANRALPALMVRNSVSNGNDTGFLAGTSATVRLARSVASANNNGVQVAGTMFSYGDNDINGNTNEGTASLTSIQMH
jgi:hypothetical protein